MRYVDAAGVAALGPAAAVDAITDALLGGVDPALDHPRVPVDLGNGQFLLMPSQTTSAAGVKVATVAPANAARGLPRVQAAYLLFDRDTLALRAVLDGAALTTLRTPAVSVAAIRHRLPERAVRMAVVGGGPQAVAHVDTLAAVHPVGRVDYLVRDPSRTTLDATALAGPEAGQILRRADVVICATSARAPLFDSAVLRSDVIVVAVGSHEPDARELDAALLARACVVVEDVDTALREAGDVVQAVAEGALGVADLVAMRDVVTGQVDIAADRALVFKSVGMAWQDLVVATAIIERR
ncbi:ornithine cyclodeaminase family protein [uncultured Jatrophihabitans sp.]|uniref:ornithine cyclodeaminase family protein n=1 Tax=uncultured Jatrophihabitans sp. TaxID=1610747 RepID=UPI0035C9B34C